MRRALARYPVTTFLVVTVAAVAAQGAEGRSQPVVDCPSASPADEYRFHYPDSARGAADPMAALFADTVVAGTALRYAEPARSSGAATVELWDGERRVVRATAVAGRSGWHVTHVVGCSALLRVTEVAR